MSICDGCRAAATYTMIVIVMWPNGQREARRYCEAERCQKELAALTDRYY